MCELCTKYGKDGEYWYLNPHNYGRRLYRRRRPGQGPAEAGADPESMAGAIVDQAIRARYEDPEHFPEIRDRACAAARQYAAGQVVTLDEALRIVEIASPLALISCICRRYVRARGTGPRGIQLHGAWRRHVQVGPVA